MHLVPPGVVAAAAAGRFGMAVDGTTLRVGAAHVPVGRITDVAALLSRLDDDGLEGSFVAVPPPLFRADGSEDDRRAWADLLNAALAEVVASAPDRLRGLAFVPAEDPALATRLVQELDGAWAGVTLGTELGERRFHEPAFDGLWEALTTRDLPVLLHPGSPQDRRLDDFYLSNLLGYPLETTIAAAHLVLGGVLERHPALKVILSHGGGAVAALVGRWSRGMATQRPGVPQLPADPLTYVRRFFVDTVTHSPAYLEFLITALGIDQILLGSDWPFPMGTASAAEGLGAMSESERTAVTVTNVVRVFGDRK
jgi:aminocarboxymuconate-semialdehyde decarboxylase